jgi:hypothetical protein
MAVQQLELPVHWQSGRSRPVAIVPFDPQTLSQRYHIQFEPGLDDLDTFTFAAIELANGHQALLRKYDNDPEPEGCVVYVDWSDDVRVAQRLIASALGIDPADFRWAAEPDPPIVAKAS